MSKAWFMIDMRNGSQWETRLKATSKEEAEAELKAALGKISEHDRKEMESFGAIYAEVDPEDDRCPLWDPDGFDMVVEVDPMWPEKEKERLEWYFQFAGCEDAIEAHWEAIVEAMDDGIREELHRELAPCEKMDFLAAYMAEDDSLLDLLNEMDIWGLETKIWYAVIDREDDDWGTGSFDLEEAKRMCLETGNDEAYIAVIDDTCENPVCLYEIHQDEF